MEAPTPISVEEILEREQNKLKAVNDVIQERTQKEWRLRQWDQRTLSEILFAVRSTVVDTYIDMMEKKIPFVDAVMLRPERWVGLGLFLLAIGFLLYIIDVLG